MASPVVATFTSAATNAQTATTINVPASTANGDLLLCFGGTSGDSTLSALAGWTLLATVTTGSTSTDANMAVYGRTAASEPANYTFNRTVSSNAQFVMLRITGIVATNNMGNASTLTQTAATVTYSAVTAQSNSALLVAGSSVQSGAVSTWTPPSGFANTFANGNTNSVAVDSLAVATAGTFGPYTGVWVGATSSDKIASYLVAVYSLLPGSLTTAPPMFNNFLVR